ncbi:MAG: hypothetical protein WDN48_11655 [Pseudolabrys sp.]
MNKRAVLAGLLAAATLAAANNAHAQELPKPADHRDRALCRRQRQ